MLKGDSNPERVSGVKKQPCGLLLGAKCEAGTAAKRRSPRTQGGEADCIPCSAPSKSNTVGVAFIFMLKGDSNPERVSGVKKQPCGLFLGAKCEAGTAAKRLRGFLRFAP